MSSLRPTLSLCVLGGWLVVGCALSHGRPTVSEDAGVARADAVVVSVDAARTVDALVVVDATPAIDAWVSSERRFTLHQGECFTFLTGAIEPSTPPTRCGDINLEGGSFPFVIGIDGTLCEIDGHFPTLASIPPMLPSACGRIVNLGETTDVAFYVHVGELRYRVHVFRTTPDMIFSFERF